MDDADLPEVVSLLEAALGPAPAGTDRRTLFEWKHLHNPVGRSIALVGVDDGQIIGVRVFMRWHFRSGDHTPFLAVRAVDTATHPAAARQGVFSGLTKAAIEVASAEGVRFIYNTPNTKSAPGYLKMGWSQVTTIPMSLRPQRRIRVARAVLSRDLQSGSALPVPSAADVQPAVATLQQPEIAALVAEHARPLSGITTDRSMAFLRWRYADGPIAYHAIQRGTGETAAIGVFRMRRRGARLTEVVLDELLARPSGQAAVDAILHDLGAAVGADHVVTSLGPGWPWAPRLGRAGFRKAPGMGMLLTARPVAPSDEPDPLVSANWEPTLGDIELF